MEEIEIKKFVLGKLNNATAVVSTEIMQWVLTMGIADYLPLLFSEVWMAESSFQELLPKFRQRFPNFVNRIKDHWFNYPEGVIIESNGTLVFKNPDVTMGDNVYYCPLNTKRTQIFPMDTYLTGELKEEITHLKYYLNNVLGMGFTTTNQPKGLIVVNSNGQIAAASTSTISSHGDCGDFELMSRIEAERKLSIGISADQDLCKDYIHAGYLYHGFDALLELYGTRGFIPWHEANNIHRILRNSGARLIMSDWCKYHKEEAWIKTWLRLYNMLIKKIKTKNVISD
jgi:hypothetical protein